MERVRLTEDRISKLACPPGKQQAFLWDTESPGLAVRVTATGAKSYIFESKLNRRTIRITLGGVKTWVLNSIWSGAGKDRKEIQRGAREEANGYKTLIDQGKDPRQVAADKLAGEQAKRDEKSAAQHAALPVLLRKSWGTSQARRLRNTTVKGHLTCCACGTPGLKAGYWSRPVLNVSQCSRVYAQ